MARNSLLDSLQTCRTEGTERFDGVKKFEIGLVFRIRIGSSRLVMERLLSARRNGGGRLRIQIATRNSGGRSLNREN